MLGTSKTVYYSILGIMFAAGEVWKENRKFVQAKLRESGFNERSIMETHLSDEINYFFNYFDRQRAKNKNLVSMHRVFKLPALNILWRSLTNARFKDDDEEVQYFIERVERLLTSIPVGTHPMYGFPILTKIPGLTPHQDLMENIGMLRDYFKVIHNW